MPKEILDFMPGDLATPGISDTERIVTPSASTDPRLPEKLALAKELFAIHEAPWWAHRDDPYEDPVEGLPYAT